MSSKKKKSFICGECGSVHGRWSGQCNECEAWNSIEEHIASSESKAKGAVARQGYAGSSDGILMPIGKSDKERLKRIPAGLSEYDLVLGGGLVRGGTVVLGGNPGAGKSTLLLQSGCHLSETEKVIYCAGEETMTQIHSRGERLGLRMDKILGIEATNVVEMGMLMEKEHPDVMIVDSIQTCFHPDLESEPGNASQLKTCAAFLNRTAKRLGVSLILVGHITKNEAIAGPMALMHIVDAVMMLSTSDDERYRILRAEKNRFGSTSEVGIFEMTSRGLIEVENPSAVFLSQNTEERSGSIVTALWEGTRPLFVEIQGLLDKSVLSNPRRVSVGIDNNRVAMLLAVINRHGNAPLTDRDVYINVVGGLRVTETSADLPIILAAISSYCDLPIGNDVMAFGEVGLSGEIRPCTNASDRIKEAVKLGYKKIIVPNNNVPDSIPKGVEICAASNILYAISIVYPDVMTQPEEPKN